MSYTNYLRWPVIAGLFLTPFIPFIISSNMFFPFITGKNFAFRILVEILLGLYLLLALKDPKYRPRFSWLFAAVAAFTLWMAFATGLAVDPVKSFWSNFERMEGYIGLLHLFAYFVIAASVLGAERLSTRFFQVSVVSSAIMGAYCLMQLSGVITINQGGVRLDGTLGNATYLAVFMLFNIFLALFLFAREPERLLARSERMRALSTAGAFTVVAALFAWLASISGGSSSALAVMLFAIVAIGGFALLFFVRDRAYFAGFMLFAVALDLVALIFTESRGPLLGLIGGLGVSGVYLLYATRGSLQWALARKVALWSIGALAVLVIAFFAVKGTAWIREIPALSRLASISLEDDTTKARFMVWGMAWQGFQDRPVQGWGQENFSYVFNQYYNPKMWGQEQWFDRTHNSFLDWLVAGGLPAFALFLSFFALAAAAFWRAREWSPLERAAMLGLLAGYALHSMFVFDNLISSIYFFTLLALAHTISQREVPGALWLSRPLSDRGLAVAAPVLGAVFIAGAYLLNAGGIANATGLLQAIMTQGQGGAAKDLSLNLAQFKTVLAGAPLGRQEATEQLLQLTGAMAPSNSVSPELKQQFFEEARAAADRIIAERKDDARLELFYGAFLNIYGQTQEALAHLSKASELSPAKQTILFELGVNNYLRQRNYAEALPVLKRAYELDPTFDTARIYYATALYANGMNAEGDALLIERYGTSTPTDIDALLQAYYSLGMYPRAIAIIEARLEKEPNNTQLRVNLASVRYTAGDKAGAIAELRKAAQIDPAFAPQAEALIKQVQEAR